MAELEPPTSTPEAAAAGAAAGGGNRSKDEIALDLMKFIAVSTGYGKSNQSSAGFSAKPSGRSGDEHVDALLDLFERCRKAVRKD